ncbi:hypothetical protein TGPRC2_211030 [Toxoplasma gondii TgCatPRC2]|uniref:Uncharacterized protein n=15 Tax=Toxoplasma gondii TaxID=5811 RepID=B9PVN7_TOXGV|nr:hypothetical protein TGME49_211030 [Toxoplasma gondii ME49]EPR58321.1 hypothetical protein TGGT1_211030 [Toxoplasma gondii GT1]ESS29657.1 hypothetical protein TGVEG_211030 [Toxoplasma gondii VEG]KAF4645076.1 hypothetical protein TGRH88_008920 [Toxoplasma gondii]KFG30685.1 hypothetical protein TGDOM2_211030 [Toxoplasma gondii GAB2-2007-GAL-DOM2]KFG43228.1 hypothetical protein TGP89_211030 [Toxoplasma gondii p89]KFG57878.1 hypothetical protein TGRUB_211030 [Toxoplasma gondii RUB]KFG99555.1 |eukprot:XP_002371248.1 hypothetical protein TGME49_211030 [Toxoplasma gondii ME49]
MELVSKVEDQDLLPFVGYCRIFVVDNDGLQRKTKGSRVEAPLHMRVENGKRIFSAYFPPKDPVTMLKIQSDEQEFIYGKLWVGTICKPEENPNTNRLLCVIQGQNCKRLSEEVDSSPDSTCKCKAYMPFLPECYSKPVDVRLTTADEKFVTKLVKLEVEVPDEMYEPWMRYYKTLKKVDQEDKNGEKDEKK